MGYRVELDNEGAMKFRVRSRDYEFIIDNKGDGITPPDTLLASLASCVGVYMRKYLDGANIKLDTFRVSAEGELSKDAPVSFKEINISIDAPSLKIDDRRKQALLNFIKNCPVHNTLKSNPEIFVKFV